MKSPIPFKHVAETGSTNQDLLDSVGAPIPGPTALLTDSQSAGRGRLGRTWHNSPASSQPVQAMLGSVRLDWPTAASTLSLMPFVAGLAVQSACNRWVEDPEALGLKWPNDVIIDDTDSGFRKIAGVLVEATPVPDSDRTAVVVGAGVNIWPVVGADVDRSSPASLSQLCSTPPTNVQLFQVVLSELQTWSDVVRSDPVVLMDRYRLMCRTTGRTVSFDSGTGVVEAVAVGVEDDGSLTVRTNDGQLASINSGDVQIQR